MATDITVRRVKGTSANIATTLASDLSTAGVNAAKVTFINTVAVSADCIIIVYGYTT